MWRRPTDEDAAAPSLPLPSPAPPCPAGCRLLGRASHMAGWVPMSHSASEVSGTAGVDGVGGPAPARGPVPAIAPGPTHATCGYRRTRPSSHHAPRARTPQLRGRDPGPLCFAPAVLALFSKQGSCLGRELLVSRNRRWRSLDLASSLQGSGRKRTLIRIFNLELMRPGTRTGSGAFYELLDFKASVARVCPIEHGVEAGICVREGHTGRAVLDPGHVCVVKTETACISLTVSF